MRSDIYIVPQGFRLDEFTKRPKKKIIIPHDVPIIGYIGAINYRLDFRLLVAVAKHFPMLKFVFVGPTQEEEVPLGKIRLRYAERNLFSLPNVIRISGVDKTMVPGIIAQFDIGMIPYESKQDFNRFCYPMKLFEYFYLGKPVISTPIEELKRFPKFLKIGRTAPEWEKEINTLLAVPWPNSNKSAQRRIATDNNWKNKIDSICSFI
jgi:glycosyltransferase involved in cell wall biosynthesis